MDESPPDFYALPVRLYNAVAMISGWTIDDANRPVGPFHFEPFYGFLRVKAESLHQLRLRKIGASGSDHALLDMEITMQQDARADTVCVRGQSAQTDTQPMRCS